MADEQQTDQTDATTEVAAVKQPTGVGGPGCCYITGKPPFQTTEQDCLDQGGRWQPGPCPSQPSNK